MEKGGGGDWRKLRAKMTRGKGLAATEFEGKGGLPPGSESEGGGDFHTLTLRKRANRRRMKRGGTANVRKQKLILEVSCHSKRSGISQLRNETRESKENAKSDGGWKNEKP